MLNLELELIAILILTAVIGVLMGRFLCKSGEHDEREKKEKVIHAYKSIQNELEISRERVKEQFYALKELEDTVARGEQEITNFNTKLLSSDTQRKKLLEELKVLEKYKPRFESLTKEFEIQAKTLERLNEEKIANQKEISDFKILTNELHKQISNLKGNQKDSESSATKLKEKLDEQRNLYEKKIEEQEIKYKEMISLIKEKHQSQQASKEEVHEELEEKSRLKYKEMLENKSEELNLLKKELDSVEDEYEAFKINYSLDNDRLEKLESDHQAIYHTLESIVAERDDLMGRLRAISSVVGAVGVENGEVGSSLSLIEKK